VFFYDCYIVDGQNKANIGLCDCTTCVVVNDDWLLYLEKEIGTQLELVLLIWANS
jgi:hypothetical protein